MKNGRVGMASTTDFDTKAQILADVWVEYRDEEAFQELLSFADLGFPLAHAYNNKIIRVEPEDEATWLIEQTFGLLLQLLNVEDTGYKSITDLFDTAEKKNVK